MYTVYNRVTGRIIKSLMMSNSEDINRNYNPETEDLVEGRWSTLEYYCPEGVVTDRPMLTEDVEVEAPYTLDLTEVEGDTSIIDELGTVLVAPGRITVELTVGTYQITPPFPWKKLTLEVMEAV